MYGSTAGKGADRPDAGNGALAGGDCIYISWASDEVGGNGSVKPPQDGGPSPSRLATWSAPSPGLRGRELTLGEAAPLGIPPISSDKAPAYGGCPGANPLQTGGGGRGGLPPAPGPAPDCRAAGNRSQDTELSFLSPPSPPSSTTPPRESMRTILAAEHVTARASEVACEGELFITYSD